MLAFVPLGLFAQQTIDGNITDVDTGAPLPGVNVVVKGTTNGATSDFDGNYSISVSSFPVYPGVFFTGISDDRTIGFFCNDSKYCHGSSGNRLR